MTDSVENRERITFTGCLVDGDQACFCVDRDLCNQVECSQEGFASLGPFVLLPTTTTTKRPQSSAVADGSSGGVGHNSSGGVAHSSSGGVAQSSSGGVAHSSSGGVTHGDADAGVIQLVVVVTLVTVG